MPKARKKKQCTVCDKKVVNLKEHMLIHIGVKDFACPVCDKSFSLNCNLKTHMLIHTGVKDFACPVCAQIFRHGCNLKRHMLIHTGVKDFACPVCEQRFRQGLTLKTHMLIHTGEKPFACPECTQRFRQRRTLNNHMLTHTGEKPFACPECTQRFRQRGTLNTHMLIHTGEKPFACTECTHRCRQSSNLTKHLAVVHDLGDYECTLCYGNCSRLRPWVDPATNDLAQCCRKCYMLATGKDIRIEHEWSLFLDEEFHPEFRICADTQVNSCNTSRPDGLWATPGLVLHWELDEYQHSGKNYSCEERRISKLYDQFPGNKHVVVRVNPHSYRAPGTVKPLQKDRKHLMLKVLEACLTKEWDTMIHVVYMFYSADNPNITQNISKTMMYDAQDVENFCQSSKI